MDKKNSILFTATFHTPFIQQDLDILRSQHHVTEIISSGFLTVFQYWNALTNIDITYSWFASVYSSILVFLTKISGKKSVLIIGGVDVAKEKAYNYGIWNSWWKSIIVRYGIMNANLVLAVDESLKLEAIRLCKYSGKNIQVIPTGYDPQLWTPHGTKKIKVLSVGIANDIPRLKKKGFDILFEAAALLPDIDFIIIGISSHLLDQFKIPHNVQCLEKVSQTELLDYYRSSKVFSLLSRHEGLPNVLCEAMLCGCVPVGSNRNGIPHGIGDAGYVVDPTDLENITKAIRTALNTGDDAGSKARARIESLFPLENRRRDILNVLRVLNP